MKVSALRTLMLGLLYPAIVGTAFYQIVNGSYLLYVCNEAASMYLPVLLGCALLVFFCACYVRAHEIDHARYSGRVFLCDLAEVGGIFVAFTGLGLFAESTPSYTLTYFAIALTVVIQWVWSRFTTNESPSRTLTGLRLVMILGFGFAAYGSASGTTPPLAWHVFWLIAFAACLAVYIWNIKDKSISP